MVVVLGLLGPLQGSDNPLQATYTLGTCQTSVMCCHNIIVRFLADSENLCPADQSKYDCTSEAPLGQTLFAGHSGFAGLLS